MISPTNQSEIYRNATPNYPLASRNILRIFGSLKFAAFLLLLALGMILFTPVCGSGQNIQLTDFIPPSAQNSVNIAFTITGASDKRVKVKLDSPVYAITSEEITFSTKGEHILVVNLVENVNTITIIGFKDDNPVPMTISCAAAGGAACMPGCAAGAGCGNQIQVDCKSKFCNKKLTEKTVAYEFGKEPRAEGPRQPEPGIARAEEPAAPANPAKKDEKSNSHISITKPSEDGRPVRYQNAGEVPLEIRVDQKPDKKDNIKSVSITVLNPAGPVNQKQSTLELEYAKKTTEPAVLQPSVRVGKGSNTVTVFDPKDEKNETTSINIICEGEKCGEVDDESPVDRFSSIYARGIVGIEQSGGSAAKSGQKPFLEFFWNPPVWTSEEQAEPFRYIYPRASLWGSVRFTSVPQQISTPLVTFAPSFLTPINEANVNKLVQGFDFLFGGEVGFGRGFSKGDIGTAFLPTGTSDTKQKFSAYFFAGFGAVSPLSPTDSVQIFAAPKTQAELDKISPGLSLPAGTEFIAFTGPDRDSFFRQWYAGVRLKTHYFSRGVTGKLEVVNRPGAIFDIGVGQNEAVTGGRLHGMVMRFDGFYPLPVSNRSILYLYGTALINLRRHATVIDPLILATAPSNVTVPADNVFIITSQPSNRDLYRIGLGVNLIELFKGSFNKKEEKK